MVIAEGVGRKCIDRQTSTMIESCWLGMLPYLHFKPSVYGTCNICSCGNDNITPPKRGPVRERRCAIRVSP